MLQKALTKWVFSSLLWASIPLTYAAVTSTTHDQIITWQRAPIRVTLAVGKEHFISFPTTFRFGYAHNRLPESLLRVQNNDHTLYLLAKKPFQNQRTEVQLSSGEMIFLDIQAAINTADNRPIDVVLAKSVATLSAEKNSSQTPFHRLDAVSLTRYAIQQLYAPLNHLKPSTTITRFPMHTGHLVPLVTNTTAIAMPLASWRGSQGYVTAVELKNQMPQTLYLTPQQLCGHWQTVSFYPRQRLLPLGSSQLQDSTTAFLVSTTPFAAAIQSCPLSYAPSSHH